MKKSLLKLLLFFLLIIGAVFLARYFGLKPEEWSIERVQTWIESFGAIAPLVFIAVYALGPILLFPGSVLTIAGGLAFGWLTGGFYVLIGANLSANAAFLVARFLGRDFVAQATKGKAEKIASFIEREGFFAVLLMRLIPAVPFNVLNYAAGLAPVRWLSYFGATLLGMIPGIFVYVYLGDNLDYQQPAFWLALVMLLTLAIVPLLYRKIKGKDVAE